MAISVEATCRRRHGQGPDPRHDRPDRHRWRSGLRPRIPGEAVRALSMEGRMTVCNMSIEAGARAGMIAPDETTFAYLEGRPHAPGRRRLGAAVDDWATLATDADAVSSARSSSTRETGSARHVGDQSGPGRAGGRVGAGPGVVRRRRRAGAPEQALPYMGLTPGRRCRTSPSTRCSSARARMGASRICGPRPTSCAAARSPPGWGLIVPGSMQVKADAMPTALREKLTNYPAIS